MLSNCGLSNACLSWSLHTGRKVIGWFGLIFSITGPVAAVILFPVSFHIKQVILGSLLNVMFSIILIIAMERESIFMLQTWVYYRKTTIILNTAVYVMLNFYYSEAESFKYILLFDISYLISQLFNIYCIIVIQAFIKEIQNKADTCKQKNLLLDKCHLTNNNNIIMV